jgi:serine protease AprX
MPFRAVLAIGIATLFLAIPASAMDIQQRVTERPLIGASGSVFKERPACTIDRSLAAVFEKTPTYSEVEAVIQFMGRITPQDRHYMEALDIRVIQEYRVIPAVYAVGTKEALEFLAQSPRTFWMEHNSQMELLMNGTTTVINATTVWNSEIIYKGGGTSEPIDGKGVTVALVDTGCDAGHPDLDYGSKVIINLKSDFDQTFTEVENSDTGSGHGTHCAGTILGNGDASAGARRGVAPGARLVAISTGEHYLQNVLGALQWVYEHSRPGNNPYNIRVCSNSWGAGPGEYDPADSITQVNDKLVFENNVQVVFAAGNSGGIDGSTIQTSNYGNAPFVLEVAAALHDGEGMASFSSRGQSDLNQTWPDIAAPGYHIWATEARGTQITAETTVMTPADRSDAYYMSISGTSMATPHVAGLCALLFQAAPSLRVSDVHSETAENGSEWAADPNTRIHECEYILKLTSDYMTNESNNGVPDNSSNGSAEFDQRPHDYAQGYGLVNASRAVQVALILEQMRMTDICATALQALHAWQRADGLAVVKDVKKPVSSLVTSWKGDWGYLLDDRNTLVTKHARMVYIPQNASQLKIDLNYNPTIGSERAAGELTVAIDSNLDGGIEWRGQSGWNHAGTKHDEVSPSTIGSTGTTWAFYIEGNYFRLPVIQNHVFNQYKEVLVTYNLGVEAVFGSSGEAVEVPAVDLHAAYAQWEWGQFQGGGNGTIQMPRYFFDLNRLVPEPKPVIPPQTTTETSLWLGVLALVAAAAALFYLWRTGKLNQILPRPLRK